MIVSPPWLKRTKVAANLRVVQKQISLDLELELEAGILQLLFDTPLKLKNGLTFLLLFPCITGNSLSCLHFNFSKTCLQNWICSSVLFFTSLLSFHTFSFIGKVWSLASSFKIQNGWLLNGITSHPFSMSIKWDWGVCSFLLLGWVPRHLWFAPINYGVLLLLSVFCLLGEFFSRLLLQLEH